MLAIQKFTETVANGLMLQDHTVIKNVSIVIIRRKRETDSDGDEQWRTVDSGTKYVDFFKIEDSTGDILISLKSLIREARKSPNLSRDYYVRRGDYRYTEERIDLNEEIFMFAMALKNDKGYEINFSKQGSYSPILTDGSAVSSHMNRALECY